MHETPKHSLDIGVIQFTLTTSVMAVQIFTTKYGKEALQFEDYEYRFDKVSSGGDYLFWRCTRPGCSARLWTDADPSRSNPQLRSEHNHEPAPDLREMKNVVQQMKTRAASETTPVPQIYREESRQLLQNRPDAVALLPPCHELSGTLYFKRHQLYPPLPHSVAQVVIPQYLQVIFVNFFPWYK